MSRIFDIWCMLGKSLFGQYNLFWWPMIFVCLFMACGINGEDIPKNIVDIEVETIRYDRLFFSTNATLDSIQSAHPIFTEVYARNVLGIPWQDSIVDQIRESTELQLIQSDIERIFSDENSLQQSVNELFSFAQHYFPDKYIPSVYFINSLFNLGSFTIGDSIAAVGFDFFLGSSYAKYPTDIFPNYIRQTMAPAYWPSRLAEAWLNEQLGYPFPERMVDYAIKNGVILYLKKKLLPKTADTVIFEYTEDQLIWLYENESEIWSFLIKEDLLYSRNFRDFQKLVNPSPSGVNGMPAETPGRAANFIGFRIVEAYVKRNATVSVEDLLTLDDYDAFFQASKYKPRLN